MSPTSPSLSHPRVVPLGEAAFTVELGVGVDLSLHRRVLVLAARLRETLGARALEIVPTYAAVGVYFDPRRDTFAALAPTAEELARRVVAEEAPPPPRGRLWEIPARYDGCDLASVAAAARLCAAEVVAIHSSATYTVCFLGFAPGFAYLGQLDERLVLPRRPAPRKRIEPGTIAIAGRQTAIYPLPTAGGWHLLGRTDLKLFDPNREPAALLAPGDTVRFLPS